MFFRIMMYTLFSVVGTTFAVVAQDLPTTVITQGRPMFHDLGLYAPADVRASAEINIVKNSQRGTIGKKFAEWGWISPKFELSLSVVDQNNIEAISWVLPKEYYFPETPFNSDKINVIAWHTFPVTMKVRCTDEPDFKIYRTWVEVAPTSVEVNQKTSNEGQKLC